jgi:hypothetical protein
MANDIYEPNGVDLKIKRNENKDIDDKEIDIIMDLFEQKGCQPHPAWIEMRRSEESEVQEEERRV